MAEPRDQLKNPSDEQIRKDIAFVRSVGERLGRGKYEIYKYLTAVYRLYQKWAAASATGTFVWERAARIMQIKMPTRCSNEAIWVTVEATWTDNSLQGQKNKHGYRKALQRAARQGVSAEGLTDFLRETTIKPPRERIPGSQRSVRKRISHS